jgi:hypothetical protein
MQPEQDLEPNISVTSVPFELLVVALKLSVSCSIGSSAIIQLESFIKAASVLQKRAVFMIILDFLTSHEAGYQFLGLASRRLSLKLRFRFYPTPTLSLAILCLHALRPLDKWSVPYRIWI